MDFISLGAKMRKLTHLALLVLIGYSCTSGNTETSPSDNDSNQIIKIDPDSIQRLFDAKIRDYKPEFPAQQVLEKGKLNPVDQSILNPSFFLFFEDFKKAVREKDLFGLLDKVDENIKNGFGGDDGFAKFVEQWQLAEPEKAASSPIWTTLERILPQGGIFNSSQKEYYAPYYTATFPNNYEPYGFAAILGAGVRFRQSPNLDSRVLGVLSYDIVGVIESNGPEQTINGETFPWVKIKFKNKEGYVFGAFVGTTIDQRITFTQHDNGIWKMASFLAGD